MPFYVRRRFNRSRSNSLRRKRSFRPGAGRRLMAAVRRARVPPALMPESKYVDSYYGISASTANQVQPPAASSESIFDGNGPATVIASTNAGGPAQIGIINGPAFNERIGRKVFLRYMSVRAQFYFNYLRGSGVAPNISVAHARLMLFYDRQPNKSLPASGELMNNPNGLSVLSFQEDKNRDRFVRLWDHTAVLTINSISGAYTPNDNSIVTVTKRVKINGVQVYDDTGAGGVGAIQTGSLVWAFFIQEGSTGAQSISCDLSTRLRYTDL